MPAATHWRWQAAEPLGLPAAKKGGLCAINADMPCAGGKETLFP